MMSIDSSIGMLGYNDVTSSVTKIQLMVDCLEFLNKSLAVRKDAWNTFDNWLKMLQVGELIWETIGLMEIGVLWSFLRL